MKDNGGCFLNTFLILGLLALILTVTYRVAFYANYLSLETDEVVFDWTGGEQNIYVSTDARSWIVEDDENVYWASFSNWGSTLHIYAYQNTSKEDRSAYIKIRSGSIKGLGNEWRWLSVVQKGKQATYLNASKQTISFSERGGSESLQISTDGDGWYVTDCPSWIAKSVSGNTLVLKVSANNDVSRSGTVRINSEELSTKIEVVQYGNLLYSQPAGNFYCDGIYDCNESKDYNGHALHTPNLDLNLDHFRFVFSFKALSYNGRYSWESNYAYESDRQWIIVQGTTRRLGICLYSDGSIWVTTNNQNHYYSTNLIYAWNSFMDIDVEYDHGLLRINGNSLYIEMDKDYKYDRGFHYTKTLPSKT